MTSALSLHQLSCFPLQDTKVTRPVTQKSKADQTAETQVGGKKDVDYPNKSATFEY